MASPNCLSPLRCNIALCCSFFPFKRIKGRDIRHLQRDDDIFHFLCIRSIPETNFPACYAYTCLLIPVFAQHREGLKGGGGRKERRMGLVTSLKFLVIWSWPLLEVMAKAPSISDNSNPLQLRRVFQVTLPGVLLWRSNLWSCWFIFLPDWF